MVVAHVIRKLMSYAILLVANTEDLCFCERAMPFQNDIRRPADELVPFATAFSQRSVPVQTSGASIEFDTIRMVVDQWA